MNKPTNIPFDIPENAEYNLTPLGDVKCQMIKSDGLYTAVCNNMGTFGQGKTSEEAIKSLCKSTISALEYLFDEVEADDDFKCGRFDTVNTDEELKALFDAKTNKKENKIMSNKETTTQSVSETTEKYRVEFAPIHVEATNQDEALILAKKEMKNTGINELTGWCIVE